MKTGTTRFAAIVIAALLSTVAMFTANVSAQETVKPAASAAEKIYLAGEIMQMIKDGKLKFKTPDGKVFSYSLSFTKNEELIYSSAEGYSGSTQAKRVDYAPEADKICLATLASFLPSACFQVIKKDESTLVIHTFTNPPSVRVSTLVF